MRYIFFLLLIPTLCFSQDKKDSKIIVTVTDTVNLADRIARAFQVNEFSIDNKDAGFVSTREKSIKAGFPTDVKLRALIDGNKVMITGDLKLNVSVYNQPPSYQRIVCQGSKGSPARLSWDEMDRIAKAIEGQITYAK